MTAIVVGGSSGLGRALCEALAARGSDLVIVASSEDDCRRLADHLRLLHGIRASPLALDARNPVAFRDELARGVATVGPVTGLFLPIGSAVDDDHVGEAEGRLADIWTVNYAAVVLAAEALRSRMAPGARIVGFGSIASVRARNRNLQYAAAKAALATYFEGLRYALAGTDVRVQFYVVGYVDSGQAFGKAQLFPPISPARAAARVLADGDSDFGRCFLPRWWAVVALILRLLPWRIFARLGF